MPLHPVLARLDAVADTPGDISTRSAVRQFVADEMAAGHSDELVDVMARHLEDFLTGWLTDAIRQRRLAARTELRSKVTVERATMLAGGQTPPPVPFRFSLLDQRYTVDARGTRRQLRDMTRQDHEFVAGQHEANAAAARVAAVWHRAVAARLADGQVTGDVFDDDALVDLDADLAARA